MFQCCLFSYNLVSAPSRTSLYALVSEVRAVKSLRDSVSLLSYVFVSLLSSFSVCLLAILTVIHTSWMSLVFLRHFASSNPLYAMVSETKVVKHLNMCNSVFSLLSLLCVFVCLFATSIVTHTSWMSLVCRHHFATSNPLYAVVSEAKVVKSLFKMCVSLSPLSSFFICHCASQSAALALIRTFWMSLIAASSRYLKPTFCDGVGSQGLENLCCVGSTVGVLCARLYVHIISMSGCVRVSMNSIVV